MGIWLQVLVVGYIGLFLVTARMTSAVQAADPADAPEIMTSSSAYCTSLQDRLRIKINDTSDIPPHEVLELVVEGKRLCESGQVRGGIHRLRRALTLISNGSKEP